MKYEVMPQGCFPGTKDWFKSASVGICTVVLLLASAQGAGNADSKPPKEEKKVTLCHKGHTIEVSESAKQAHLAHGDFEGPCDITPSKNK